MNEEGYTKFDVQWEPKRIAHNPLIPLVNKVRARCYDKEWIGMLPDGIGFGNISVRLPGNTIMITGTQTGHKRLLTIADYAVITNYDIANNQVQCIGIRQASSESLTHASLYAANESIAAVIHIHQWELWSHYYNKLPTTAPDITYGTPEMGKAVQAMVQQYPGEVIVMGGHRAGILAYGNSLPIALNKLEALE